MRREYRRRFGIDGEVLLPSRGRESIWFGTPRHGVENKTTGLIVAYAGSVYGGNFLALDAVAGALAERGHKLVIYTPSVPPKDFQARFLEIRAPLPSNDLIKELREEADILLLWTDFSPANREVVRTLFPSKMVDYTAAAVPIVAIAPQDACIVDFLSTRPEAGEVVTTDVPAEVARVVENLASRPERRLALAKGAAAAGAHDFSYENAWRLFIRALGRT
jgi:hypothetical protein